MHLTFNNVNDGFRGLVRGFADGSIPTDRTDSRNGPVLRAREPMLLAYTSPPRRVLFNAARDVNPFSLLYEALWTLAGRNDVAPIAWYTKRMTDYSDDGATWRGAYGYRWRHSRPHMKRVGTPTNWENTFLPKGSDQLDRAVELLRANPASRRVVLTMWDAELDLFGQTADGRDYPCNSHTYLQVRNGGLDLTVCNRSNDMIWGHLGANWVTLTVLQEYLAARIGTGVGTYHVVTNDLHAYENNWKPAEWLADRSVDVYSSGMNRVDHLAPNYTGSGSAIPKTVPLVNDPAAFEAELPSVVGNGYGPGVLGTLVPRYTEPFLNTVAVPMFRAFAFYKADAILHALQAVTQVASDDWRIAAEAWLRRRLARRTAKGGVS